MAFLVFTWCAFWRASFSPEVSAWDLAANHLLQGVAMASFFISLTTLILSGLEQQRVPAASGLYNFMRIMAGSFAASVWTTWWENGAISHHAYLTESITPGAVPLTQFETTLSALGFNAGQIAGTLEGEITRQSFIVSATDLFALSGGLFLALAGLVWLSRPSRS